MYSHFGKQWQFLQKLKINFPRHPEIPRESKPSVLTKMCEQIFTAALFIMAPQSGNDPDVHQLGRKDRMCINGELFGNKKEQVLIHA